jgi:hypothetical protein
MGIGLLVMLLVAERVAAEPVDLGDPRPREIEVSFEVSPPEQPGQLASRFTRHFRAHLEPASVAGLVKVTIPGWVVEENLVPDREVAPGSFSDFVWIFDAETGHVRSATVSGVVRHEMRLGRSSWKTDAAMRARMNTLSAAGFSYTRMFGAEFPRLCRRKGRGCTWVEPRTYDKTTGYVNAVGEVTARSGALRISSFSPLGEAIFRELAPALADVAAPPPAE